MPLMAAPIALVGVPTALGGHLSGMELSPIGLRALGLVEMLRARPGLAGADVRDAGDVAIDTGFLPDPDPRAKNRAAICTFLPRERDLVATTLGGPDGAATRLLIVGGDCTAHAGAMAGLRAARPDARIAIAWFDAHGDFNVPTTTPSGNVWGMPFAMLCGRGDPSLVKACDGPTVKEEDAALLGGQVLDQEESRMLAASPIAHFGAGMLAGPAGLAALETWARVVGARCDGMYIAFDLDAIDSSESLSVAMPERGGISVWTAVIAVRLLAASNRIVGFGPTATMPRSGTDLNKTADVVAQLTEAALGA